MPDSSKHIEYEQKLAQLQRAAALRIQSAYESAILEITLNAAFITRLRPQDKSARIFRIKDYPTLLQTIERVMNELHTSIYATVVNTMMDGWDLSVQKNNILLDKRFQNKAIEASVKAFYYDPNLQARNAFIARKERGLNLSDRVWKTLENYKVEMEGALGIGISEGKSATQMASQLKSYLREPDKLFRRVKDAKGELQLSKAAKNYHPGQGLYRSSFKNALRLTASETNLSYRYADFERWQRLPFVVGIEVKLSNNHPEYDICDQLKGLYPKDFKFGSWHPRCRCYSVPVMMSDEEYSIYEDNILSGSNEKVRSINNVKAPPKLFTTWIRDNRERVEGWKNRPYWWQDNRKYINKSLKQ